MSHIFLDVIGTKDALSKDNENSCPISNYEKEQTSSKKGMWS